MYYAVVVGMLSVSSDIVEIMLFDTKIVVVWIANDILDTILNVTCILCLRLLVSVVTTKCFSSPSCALAFALAKHEWHVDSCKSAAALVVK